MSTAISIWGYGNSKYYAEENVIRSGFAGNLVTKPRDGVFHIKRMGITHRLTATYLDILASKQMKSMEFDRKRNNTVPDHDGIISDWLNGFTKSQICVRRDVSISVCTNTLKGM